MSNLSDFSGSSDPLFGGTGKKKRKLNQRKMSLHGRGTIKSGVSKNT